MSIIWLGDGTGVGKGRTLAGIIYENYQKDRKKSIWVSASNDLKFDVMRDLKDIGASHIGVWDLSTVNKNNYIRNIGETRF